MSELHYYFPPTTPRISRHINVDVCAYGTSPGAITAALQARRCGLTVALVVNGPRLGGLTAGGLSNTDIGNQRAIGGLAREFYQRVGSHYAVDEEWRFEPHVAEQVFQAWLEEAAIVPLLREYPELVNRDGARLVSVRFESGLLVTARQFIDASYEGDLMALAKVSSVVGRESNATYGENLNGVQVRDTHQFELPVDPYVRPGDLAGGLLRGINPEPLARSGSGDKKVQAYNFRLCLTSLPNRLPFPKPDGYDPRDYELLARYLDAGWRDLFKKFDRIRGHKTDTNNHGAVSTDFIGGSWAFPLANWRDREKIFQAHVRWQQGLLWFLANDPRVQESSRVAMRGWGLAADEFTATGGWPHHLYIREARRLAGEHVITEHDCLGRSVASDGIGLGAYAMDSHNCQRVVVDGRVRNEGDVQVSGFSPYPISYRAITPRRAEAENLLVPVCLSASHIAYGSIRMEPVFMILGQSAALAAHLALKHNLAVQDVPYPELCNRMKAGKQIVSWTESDSASASTAAVYEPEAPPPVEPEPRTTPN